MGGTNGFVNNQLLFHVGYGLNQPQDGYVLSGELPLRTRKGFATEKMAQERAEKRLERFVEALGASFPAEPSEATEKLPVAEENPFERWWAERGADFHRSAAKREDVARAAFESGFEAATEAAREMLDIRLEDD
jgi:hypothetical protein